MERITNAALHAALRLLACALGGIVLLCCIGCESHMRLLPGLGDDAGQIESGAGKETGCQIEALPVGMTGCTQRADSLEPCRPAPLLTYADWRIQGQYRRRLPIPQDVQAEMRRIQAERLKAEQEQGFAENILP